LAAPYFNLPAEKKKINILGKEFYVWVARNNEQRKQGLQNIFWLPASRGMLFIFPAAGLYCFWNKNTFLDLKLIFMKEEKIVKIEYLPAVYKARVTICPTIPADAVLELPCSLEIDP
jgi:uncharacterized membrane protein (UPF0127 family)